MPAYTKTRSYLEKYQLAPTKKLGQNFLIHRHTAEAIVDAGQVAPDDSIVEVGVGMGALTQPLAARVKNVIGIEVDRGIVGLHQQEKDLPENVYLLHADILRTDWAELARMGGGKLKIMANLPYSISNPFIFTLIENRQHVQWATVLLQKEVADRLTAAPNSKEYGVSTILLASCASVKKVLYLKPEEFHPRPKVDSAVVRIDIKDGASASDNREQYDFALFQKIVRTTFGNRRKMLRNTLTAAGVFLEATAMDEEKNRELTEKALQNSNISPLSRPESLDLQSFIRLTKSCQQLLEQVNHPL